MDNPLDGRRIDIGRAAERLAARFLERRGMEIVERNLRLPGGEIDLVVSCRGRAAAIEVRSLTHSNPIEAFDRAKVSHVRELARTLGVLRVDLIAVRFLPMEARIHWIPDVDEWT